MRSDANRGNAMALLAIDIGGTKTLAALLDGPRVITEREIATARSLPRSSTASANGWCDAVVELVKPWQGRYAAAGVAVTGVIDNGRWSALNPATLPVPDGFPLQQRLRERLDIDVLAVNDAHAAAWAEYRFGAGQGCDMVYLTISTGIGGGAVINGRLLTGRHGLAASVGQLRLTSDDKLLRVEDQAAGQWMAAQACQAGYPDANAKQVFAAAAAGQAWAEAIVARSAAATSLLLHNVQLLLAPERIIIGGGIGLADGYLACLEALLAVLPPLERPALSASVLGKHAGVIGAADLAKHSLVS